MELLYTFIECSIAILAFASIVAQFKKNSASQWNVHHYQGIIVHSIQAFVFSCLPLLLIEFKFSENIIWILSCSFLALLTIFQATMVMIKDKISKLSTKLIMFLFSLFIVGLQFLYINNTISNPLAVYNVGIFWHLIQSIYLIVNFIIVVEINKDEEFKKK